jgi:hypothetical protein
MVGSIAMKSRRLAVLFVLLSASACLPRERFNKACEWTGDSPRPLDLHDSPDEQHLIQDAQLAEELTVRYADFKHKEPFGYEGHGGLLQHGKVAQDCLEKLDGIIESNHRVTRNEIVEARKRRDWRFDSGVVASFAVLYALSAVWASGWLAKRFRENGLPVLSLLQRRCARWSQGQPVFSYLTCGRLLLKCFASALTIWDRAVGS